MAELLKPLYELLGKLQLIGPGLLWAAVIIIVGYFISSFIGWLVKKILYGINLDKRLRKSDLHDSLGSISIAKLTGKIIMWYVFILFLNQAISYVALGEVSRFISKIVTWLPKLIASLIIIIIGLIIIDFIVNKLLEFRNRFIEMLASLIKAILIVVVIFTAIENLGIKTDLAQNIFLMVIAAILITLSLALGIGLGLGIKDEVKPLIQKYGKKKRRR
jgi:hypothetical protein